jgi:hypothetical protein
MDTLRFTAATATCELAQRRLCESPYFFLKRLTCHFNSGVLTLRGRVPHRQLREVAEKIVSRVDGIRSIDNQVEVSDPSSWAPVPTRRASA